MRARRVLVATAAMTLLLVGCADDEGGEVDTGDSITTTTIAEPAASVTTEADGTTTTSTSAPDVTIVDGGIDPLDDADRADKHGAGTDTGPNYVTDVRIGRHEGYDRFVIELRDEGMPEWWVTVGERELTGDPSGEPIDLEGTSRLDLRMYPASRVEFTDEEPGYVEIYTGPDRIAGTSATMAEAVLVGDFEANLLWAIGLRDPVDFRVLELTNPTRLVIDVRNH